MNPFEDMHIQLTEWEDAFLHVTLNSDVGLSFVHFNTLQETFLLDGGVYFIHPMSMVILNETNEDD